jgi:carbon-monoxide dehydrogenase large subunit
VQSVGSGLLERIEFDDLDTPITTSLLEYAIPKASQESTIETEIAEVPTTAGSFGAERVGEPTVIPGPAALAETVHAAHGARVLSLRITPDRARAALAT